MPNFDDQLQQAIEQTVAKPDHSGGMHLIQWLAKTGLNAFPWWSPSRDRWLRDFWKQSDHMSGAIYTMQSKMSAIPVQVLARDTTIRLHVEEAMAETDRLMNIAELGEGWVSFYERFIEDLTTQDNGGFGEIIGAGDPSGPVVGRPTSIRHLDSSRCQRTGDPEYPVIYHHVDGKMYKLHYTRVMYRSQMSSPIADMYGVGYSAVSRAIGITQNLMDIVMYKQEKLGSRPYRGIMVTKGGLDPEEVKDAFSIVAQEMDSQGLSRYSKIAVVGSSSLPDADLELKDISGLPDNFDERTSIELGMAVIALAFGLDARELFPALSSGATRADALIQHLKQRGKGPGQIIQMTELMFNQKYLPAHLRLVFDYQDDEQDRQTAEVKQTRAQRWSVAIRDGTMDIRTAREQMVEVGDMERGQFERLELEDGRLPDGTAVLALFMSNDARISKLLSLGVDDPLDIDANSYEEMEPKIKAALQNAHAILVNSTSLTDRRAALYASAALVALRKEYEGIEADMEEEETAQPTSGDSSGVPTGHPPEKDPRNRKRPPAKVVQPELDVDELEPDSDEEVKEVSGMAANPF